MFTQLTKFHTNSWRWHTMVLSLWGYLFLWSDLRVTEANVELPLGAIRSGQVLVRLRHLPHPTRGLIPSFPGTLSARRLLRGNVGPLQAAAGQDWLRSNLYLLQLKPGLEPRAIADQLTRRADVLYAEPNFIVRVSTLPPQLATKDSQ